MSEKEDDKKVLKVVPGQAQLDAFQSALRFIKSLEEDPDGVLQVQRTLAKLRKQKYDSLVEAGFKPEQALEIIARSPFGEIF